MFQLRLLLLALTLSLPPTPAHAANENYFAPAYGGPVAGDFISGAYWPKCKMAIGVAGAAVDVSSTNPMPVTTAGGGTGDVNIAQILGAAPSNSNALPVKIMQGATPNSAGNPLFVQGGTVGVAVTSFAGGGLPVNLSGSAVPVNAATATNQNSQSVTLSSILSAVNGINGKTNAGTPVAIGRHDYSSVNVTTGAYVELISALGNSVTQVDIFDSSGQTLVLAVGGAGSEVDQINIFPGGNGKTSLAIANGARVSIKAVSGTANSGEIDVNFSK